MYKVIFYKGKGPDRDHNNESLPPATLVQCQVLISPSPSSFTRYMPLPDETRRPSVANLIGRFEQQQKRQPATPGPPSRATSAASNNTGDPAKEEQRMAREWPPVKTNGSASGSGISASGIPPPKPIITPSMTGSTLSSSSPPASDNVLPGQVDSHPTPMPEASPAPTIPPTAETEANPVNNLSTPAPASIAAPLPATKARPSASTSRPAAAAVVSKPTILPSSPPSKSTSSTTVPRPSTATSRFNGTKTPTPRTPSQGPGTRSAPSSLPRTAIKPSTSHAPTARPKTPAAAGASKSTAPRASLPPTPSSGLFAPTAASLAKARNAPPPPPPAAAPRKFDLSRLSKPTAASAGKVRTATAVVSPPRPAAGRGTGTAVKRGSSIMASRVSRCGTKRAAGARVEANANAETPPCLAEQQQQQSGEEDQSSHDVDDTSLDEDGVAAAAASEEAKRHEDTAAPPADDDRDETADSELESAQLQNRTAEEHSADGVWPEEQSTTGEKEADNSVSEIEAEAPSEHEPEAVLNAAEPEARLDEVKPRHATVGSDLEAMVTMLQCPSFPAATHLDVAGEIPDEE